MAINKNDVESNYNNYHEWHLYRKQLLIINNNEKHILFFENSVELGSFQTVHSKINKFDQ